MKYVTLLPLHLQDAEIIFTLSSNAHVKDALGLKVKSVEDTKAFIRFAMEEEKKNHSLSRMILNEQQEAIGITSLKHINHEQKCSHIGEKGTMKPLKKRF